MEIVKAGPAQLVRVAEITRTTIAAVYPHFYPRGVVEFFLNWHKDEKILADIRAGEVFLLLDGGRAVGTVTLHEEKLTRLYVLPNCQGKGYGRALLDYGEEAVGRAQGKIVVEASLPAKGLYLRRGYRETGFFTEEAYGDVLCWDVMEKRWTPEDESAGGGAGCKGVNY